MSPSLKLKLILNYELFSKVALWKIKKHVFYYIVFKANCFSVCVCVTKELNMFVSNAIDVKLKNVYVAPTVSEYVCISWCVLVSVWGWYM